MGTNATSREQVEWPLSELPQLLTTVKSPLAICAAISSSAASPELSSVTCWVALVVFNCCAAKERLSGVSVSVAGRTPTPVSDAVCVPTLSVMLRVPVRVPEAVGWNSIETVHPTLDASDEVQVFAEIMKSPVTTGDCSVAEPPPVLEIVMFCAALVEPTLVEAKLSAIGSRRTVAAVVPTPVSAAVACPPATLP